MCVYMANVGMPISSLMLRKAIIMALLCAVADCQRLLYVHHQHGVRIKL